jgi:hypothetical protein
MSMWMQHPDRSRTCRLLRACAVLAVLAAVVPFVDPAPAAAASAAGACRGTSGVTVVVDARNAGGVISVRCALGPQPSGWKALENAGHALTSPPQYPGTAVCQIDGLPQAGFPTCWESNVWWYSHATNPNGAPWTNSSVGAATYVPAPGSVEGWKYRSLADSNLFPPTGPGFGVAVAPVDPPATLPPATKPVASGGGNGRQTVAPNGGTAPRTPPTTPSTTVAPGASGASTTSTIAGLVAPMAPTTSRTNAERARRATTSARSQEPISAAPRTAAASRSERSSVRPSVLHSRPPPRSSRIDARVRPRRSGGADLGPERLARLVAVDAGCAGQPIDDLQPEPVAAPDRRGGACVAYGDAHRAPHQGIEHAAEDTEHGQNEEQPEERIWWHETEAAAAEDDQRITR